MASKEYHFVVGKAPHLTPGHSCYWCHRWIKTGETARYRSHGDCGQVFCADCDARNHPIDSLDDPAFRLAVVAAFSRKA